MLLWPHHGTSAADSHGRVWASPETCLLPEHPLQVVWRGWALSQTQLPSPAAPMCPTYRFWSTFSRSFLRLRWAPALRFCRPFSKYRSSEKFSYRRGEVTARRVGASSRGPERGKPKGRWGLASLGRLTVTNSSGCRETGLGVKRGSAHLGDSEQVPSFPWTQFPHP